MPRSCRRIVIFLRTIAVTIWLPTFRVSSLRISARILRRRPHGDRLVEARADVTAGARLFGNYCATCHAANGSTRQLWRTSFKRLPPDLTLGPFLHVPAAAPSAERISAFARIVKFGIPGTDMPGHEYLADRDIASISLWLADKTSIHSGEKQ